MKTCISSSVGVQWHKRQEGKPRREIQADIITRTVAKLCVEANCHLPEDMNHCIRAARAAEPWPQGQEILDRIIENFEVADRENMPICQDTGMACVFVELGTDVHIEGDFEAAINEGVRIGYGEAM